MPVGSLEERADEVALGVRRNVLDARRVRVVAADAQPNVVQLQPLHVDELVVGSRGRGRHPALEHEHAILAQVPGGVLEAADLVVLGEQVADGVEHQVDEPIGAPGADPGHVAHGHLHLVAAWLLAHPVNHVLGQLDAVDAHPGCPQRHGDASGAHRQLQHLPSTGQPGEKGDRLVLVSTDAVRVVAPGHLVAEARPGVEALHPWSLLGAG